MTASGLGVKSAHDENRSSHSPRNATRPDGMCCFASSGLAIMISSNFSTHTSVGRVATLCQ